MGPTLVPEAMARKAFIVSAKALRTGALRRYIASMTQEPTLPAGEWPEIAPGSVWLVGAGPGDPGLITLHGLNAIRQADVIVYDALVNKALLDWARPDAQIEYAGKRGGKPSPKQRDISHRLIEFAREGRRVLRLKGGDPFVFGRGGEEAQSLISAGISIRVVPGISSGIGGLAYAGIPVTHRDVNQAVTFLTGHDQTGDAPGAIDWEALAKSSPVIVGYMAIKTLPKITARLIAAGRSPSEPVAIVTDATLPEMRVVETSLGSAVEDLERAGLHPPAIVCIGAVVRMRQVLDWIGYAGGAVPRDLDPLGARRVSDAG